MGGGGGVGVVPGQGEVLIFWRECSQSRSLFLFRWIAPVNLSTDRMVGFSSARFSWPLECVVGDGFLVCHRFITEEPLAMECLCVNSCKCPGLIRYLFLVESRD